jgi:tetratricopeptide (TPR) repeat protein
MDAQSIVAQALIIEASDLERLGMPDASLQASSQAKQIDADANFPKGIGISLLIGGDVLYDKGDFNGARSRFEEAMSIFREIGDKKNQGLAFERIGNTFHDQGKFAQSQGQYARALEIYHEIQWTGGISSAIGNLANTLDAMGDLKGSLKMHDEALQIFVQEENKREIASEVNNIAFVQEELGNLPAAAEGHRKSLALHRQTGHQRGEMFALSGLGDVFLMQGDLTAARQHYAAARAIGEKTQADANVAIMDLELATIDLVEHHLGEGEARARRAIAQFEKDKDPEGGAETYALLVEILLAEQKQAEAVEAGKKVEANAAQVSSLPPQFEAGLALAQLEAAAGKKDAARKRLAAVLDRARRSGYMQYILEASRALVGLEAGNSRNVHFAALAEDARRKGYGLIPTEIAAMPAMSPSDAEIANR